MARPSAKIINGAAYFNSNAAAAKRGKDMNNVRNVVSLCFLKF